MVAAESALAGHAPMAALVWLLVFRHATLTPSGLNVWLVYCLVVYNCIGYCYFHLFNMSETARRIRILRDILAAGSLHREEILAIYGANEVVEVRLSRLEATGQLRLQAGRYVIKGRLLYWAARLVAAWRGILGFAPTESRAARETAPRETPSPPPDLFPAEEKAGRGDSANPS